MRGGQRWTRLFGAPRRQSRCRTSSQEDLGVTVNSFTARGNRFGAGKERAERRQCVDEGLNFRGLTANDAVFDARQAKTRHAGPSSQRCTGFVRSLTKRARDEAEPLLLNSLF